MIEVRLARHLRACDAELARALPFYVTGAGALEDVAGDGAAVFELLEEGRRVGALSLEVLEDQAGGRELHLMALAGAGHRGLVEAADAFVTREARERIGAQRITCETRRRGLVRKLRQLGWSHVGAIGAGVVMEKRVTQ